MRGGRLSTTFPELLANYWRCMHGGRLSTTFPRVTGGHTRCLEDDSGWCLQSFCRWCRRGARRLWNRAAEEWCLFQLRTSHRVRQCKTTPHNMIFTNWDLKLIVRYFAAGVLHKHVHAYLHALLADLQLIGVGSKHRTVCDDLKNNVQFL